MGRSKISFIRGQGSAPGVIENNDGISALQFYGSAPGTFATTACQALFSLTDAEAKGITLDYADETRPTATIPITSVGSTGDTIAITVTEANPNGGTTVVTLCTYTQAAGDTTATILGASISTAINANSYLTAPSTGGVGYTSTAATGSITLTGRNNIGVSLNTVLPVTTVVGSIVVGSIVAFASGVYSKKAVWHYTLSRFFAQNANGKVWVNFTSTPGAGYAEVQTLMNVAKGEPRQMGILNFVAKTAAQITTDLNLLQTQFNILFAGYQPCEIIFAPNIKAISDLSTLQNLQATATATNCMPVISQDGAAIGAQLFINSGVSISNLGDILGVASVAAVSQDIGEVGAFNITDGSENNITAFSNGQLFSALSSSLLDSLDSYRYCFCTTYTGYPGAYINNDWTAIVSTNAYNRLCLVRTIDKVLREQYLALLPLLKSRIYLNADGTMTDITINKYIGAAEPGIEQMVKDGDLSPGNLSGTALTAGVVNISATQNVKTQGYIAIVYNLLGVNIADSINVTLQFTQKL